ncbi:MAG: AmmeMemoRadiSam system radical SAM enzyme, partial [Planctomycetota bacterium]
SAEELNKMCSWINANLGPDVPVHFSRFHPSYRLTNINMTPVKTLDDACDIARKAGLNYIYVGNVSPHSAESTYCPKCGKVLVERSGYIVKQNVIISDGSAPQGLVPNGRCPNCRNLISGVWSE